MVNEAKIRDVRNGKSDGQTDKGLNKNGRSNEKGEADRGGFRH